MDIIPVEAASVIEVVALFDDYNRPKDVPISEEVAQQTLQAIRDQHGEVYVAIIDNEIVGTYSIYCCFNLARATRPFGMIENVICKKGYRRQGIGKALMQHVISIAEAGGWYKVCLQTSSMSKRNIAFYTACGFTADKQGLQVRFNA